MPRVVRAESLPGELLDDAHPAAVDVHGVVPALRVVGVGAAHEEAAVVSRRQNADVVLAVALDGERKIIGIIRCRSSLGHYADLIWRDINCCPGHCQLEPKGVFETKKAPSLS